MINEIKQLKKEFNDVTLKIQIDNETKPIPKINKTRLFGVNQLTKDHSANQLQARIGSFIEGLIQKELVMPVKEHLTVRDIIRYESQKTMLWCIIIMGFIPLYFIRTMKRSKMLPALVLLPTAMAIYNLRLPIKNYHLSKHGQLMLYCIDKSYPKEDDIWRDYQSFMNENKLSFI